MYSFVSNTPHLLHRTIFQLMLIFALFFLSLEVSAEPQNITEAEMKLLPRYCPDTITFNPDSPRAGYWQSIMGKAFRAMHHYCWAQITMIRSKKAGASAQTRQAMWESANGDYMYVIKYAQPDFVLLPEIYTRVGEVELLLSHPDKANEAFARARQLKPDYWPAYSRWAEFLMKIGRRNDALKVVASGLQQSPNAKVLIEQFRILGGKPSDIPTRIDEKEAVDTTTPEKNEEPAISPPLHGPDAKRNEE